MGSVNPTSTSQDLLGDLYEITPLNPASQGQRFANYLIDIIVVSIFYIAIAAFLGGLFDLNGGDSDVLYEGLFGYVLIYSAFIAYFTLMEALNKGRTVGKLLTRTYAVGIDGEPLTMQQAFYRSLCRIVPFEPFSALGSAPWHDRWTRTTVAKKK